jgi:nucleoredoxin
MHTLLLLWICIVSWQYLGLYFSAHWCGPCRSFTPLLVKFYNDRKAAGKDDFEVIFVSSDDSLDSYESYLRDMPWLAIPYQDVRVGHLKRHFKIDGIPALVILDPDMRIVNRNAVPRIRGDPRGEFFPYIPEAAQNIDHGVISFDTDYFECPSVFAFMEIRPDAEQDVAKRALCKNNIPRFYNSYPSMCLYISFCLCIYIPYSEIRGYVCG